MFSNEERTRRILAHRAKRYPHITDWNHDHGSPTRAVGHSNGISTSVAISRSYRQDHRPASQFVEPQQVVEVLRAAGVQRWVLMGLYGYVGYLAQPRATQDVDVLVDEDEVETAVTAILARWPALLVDRQPVVVRFRDPGEVAITGEIKQVIDLMLPDHDCYFEILHHAHRIDSKTGNVIPTLEAACASKFAALVSPNRQFIRKQQDAVDLRSILVPNVSEIDRDELHRLGDLVYSGGGEELLEFLELALNDKPFPV